MTKPPGTICCVTSSGSITGAGISLFNLLLSIRQESGYDIEVIFPNNGLLVDQFKDHRFPVHIVSMPMIWELPNYDYTTIGRLYTRIRSVSSIFKLGYDRNLAKILMKINPDIVHINDLPLQSAAKTSFTLGFPIIWHIRHTLHRPQSLMQSRMIRNVERMARVIVGISKDEIVCFDKTKADVRVIHNPVTSGEKPEFDLIAIERIRKEFGISASDIMAYSPIHPTRTKGISVLLRAFRIIRDNNHKDIKLIVTGAVNRNQNLLRRWQTELMVRETPAKVKRYIEEHALENHVVIRPFVSNVLDFMGACDFLLFPTMFRAIGRPVIEAAYMQKPSIVTLDTRRDGLVIHGRTGLIVKEDDCRELARAIVELAKNPEKRRAMGERAKEHIDRLCSISVVRRQMQDVYESVLSTLTPDPRNRCPGVNR